MTKLERRRRIHALGQRAIDYYDDTGLCVFCEADDVEDIPHDSGCDVGKVLGVVVNKARKKRKAEQRMIVAQFLLKHRTQE